MTRLDCDIAIVGSGFGGTLLALIASRLGFDVALLERGAHPRFAIGESSTPLADFKLAAIADEFGLSWLRPFSKYGTWKSTYPQISCGLKRGFSFFRHHPDQAWVTKSDNSNALLVGASPDDEHSDTHWFRADFDAHLVERARSAGVAYLDHLEIHATQHDRSWKIEAARPDGAVTVRAGFVVDATGDGQMLARSLDLQPTAPGALQTRSRALYAHFQGVARWQDLFTNDAATAEHPFPCDAAALHHLIDNGWMWVLRFDNGITSAGFSLDPEHHPLLTGESAEQEWRRLLDTYLSLGQQFQSAQAVRPFVRTGRLQRRWTRAAGPDWALLPHTAGFTDAWLSPGIALTLFAVERLGKLMADGWQRPDRAVRLADYSWTLLEELAWVDEISAACFACFDRFPVLTTVTMIYFAAAIFCEEQERASLGRPGFLLADDPAYRDIATTVFRQARNIPVAESDTFALSVVRALAPYNFTGLCDLNRRNMYPFVETSPLGSQRL